MDNFKLLAAFSVAALFQGCIVEPFPSMMRHDRPDLSDRHIPDTTAAAPDTILWVCGVEYDSLYDWRLDTAAGAAPSSIVLLRNGVRVLQQPTEGDADAHWLSSGGLVSVIRKDGWTFLKRGSAILSMDSGDWRITDIRPFRGELWSIWVCDTSGRMVLKRGLEDVMEAENASPQELRIDGGNLWFWYEADFAGAKEYYVVKNGEPHLVRGAWCVHDIRVVGGTMYILEIYPSGEYRFYGGSVDEYGFFSDDLRYGEILDVGGKVGFMMCIYDPTEEGLYTYEYYRPSMGPLEILHADALFNYGSQFVTYRMDGTVGVRSPCGEISPEVKACRFTQRCIFALQDRLYMALTPPDTKRNPVLWADGQVREYPLHGYLTGVYAEVQSSQDTTRCCEAASTLIWTRSVSSGSSSSMFSGHSIRQRLPLSR